ncbi:19587_t:CDS:2 [Funneliformis geosporum]|uniref:19587_t:CDS:1 n=1 Tax=Funneliformis geosporum TaxID=1117311 RepID=A0A9W4SBI5_9GLOM|nr:19587_t:CDS:2 [Funneliformis geosporum]
MEYDHTSDLHQDFLNLLENSEDFNVKFEIGKEPNIKEFEAHSLILSTRSTYFQKIFSKYWNWNEEKEVPVFKKPNISPLTFEILLKYIYTGTLSVDDEASFADIIVAADEFELQTLVQQLEKHLIQNESAWQLPKDFIKICQHKQFPNLGKYALDLACRNPKLIFESKNFLQMEQDILIQLLKCDDLELKEFEIWEHLIRWGIANTNSTTIDDDLTKWTPMDFNNLENILHNCIPHIRFFHMSPNDYAKVRGQFKSILPSGLDAEVIQYFLNLNANPSFNVLKPRVSDYPFDSKIVNAKDAALISTKPILSKASSKDGAIMWSKRKGPCFSKDLCIYDGSSSESSYNNLFDFSELLDNPNDYDVKFKVGKMPNVKEFEAHSIILRARSNNFLKALSNHSTKRKDIIIFRKPNISPLVFEILLRYIYTGVLSIKNDSINLVDIIIAAEDLGLLRVCQQLEPFLLLNETAWNSPKDFLKICKHNGFPDLVKYSLESICKDPQIIFESREFLRMEESTLIQLLKCDDLKLEEVEIWKYLVKWGIANIDPILNKNLKGWSSMDFINLEKTLRNCIPHIRFYQMLPDDYMRIKAQFKNIIPNSLDNEIIQYFLNPNSSQSFKGLPLRTSSYSFDSNIIHTKDAALIASWVDGKQENPYPILCGISRGPCFGLKDLCISNVPSREGTSHGSIVDLLENPNGFNVKVKVGDVPNVKEFRAHSIILCARTNNFYKAFSAHSARYEDGVITFMKPSISPLVFEIILKYIYTGLLTVDNNTSLVDIIIAADDFGLPKLFQQLETHLLHSASAWNFPKDLLTIRQHDRFPNLSEFALKSGPTVIVIKVRNSGECIGGYNPLEWFSVDTDDERSHLLSPSFSLYSTTNSFIFSLTNRAIPILSRVSSEHEAIFCSNSKGPCFGLKDLCVTHSHKDIVGTSRQYSYEKKIINSETFEIEEYEVFQIFDKRSNS